MNVARHLTSIKSLALTAALLVASLVLVAGLWVPAANAAGSFTVTSNVDQVASGDSDSLTLTVDVQNNSNVAELEVDNALEDFSVYASESNPYGNSEADFDAQGVTVTYDATNAVWVIDLGAGVTSLIESDHGSTLSFHFELLDADNQPLWGEMHDPASWTSFTFNLEDGTTDFVEGTEFSLVEPAEDDEVVEEDEAVIPGVPNTSVVW